MCDYCDCRLVPAIADLASDHEVLLGLTARLRDAVAVDDGGRAGAVITELADVLDAHTAREEQGVFAALRDAGSGSYVAQFESEHAALDDLLASRSRPEPAWATRSVRILTLVEAHIAVEETDLFPAARQLLGPADWDAVERTHAALRTPVAPPTPRSISTSGAPT